jgi:hypothetical protein
MYGRDKGPKDYANPPAGYPEYVHVIGKKYPALKAFLAVDFAPTWYLQPPSWISVGTYQTSFGPMHFRRGTETPYRKDGTLPQRIFLLF